MDESIPLRGLTFCVYFRLVINRRCYEQFGSFMPRLINSRVCGAGRYQLSRSGVGEASALRRFTSLA